MAGSLSAAALLTGAAVALVAFLALGLGRAARRAGLAHPRTLAVSVAAALVVWLGATAALAQSGTLADWSALPLGQADLLTFDLMPVGPLLPLGMLIKSK